MLEGETLRARLDAGPIPVPRVIEFATQLAQGLAAAHDRGIVHRDLKPENVFVTRDGVVKILDFGLAKLAPPAGSAATLPPTVTGHTAPGMVMGTVGYMSPEQVRGEGTDHRSDIFAFGAVLYEMMTGRRAFARDSPAETLSAILRDDPPLTPSAEMTASSAIARIVAHCLEKRAADRFQSARDLTFALQALSAVQSGPIQDATVAARPTSALRMLPWVIAALAVAAALAVVTLNRTAPPEEQPVRRVTIALPAAEPLALAEFVPLGVGRTAMAMAPDGSRIVYVANRGGTPHLVVRDLDRFEGKPIVGTDGAYAPFFSPDGQWVAFLTENALKRVALAGGDPVTLAEVRNGTAAAWTESGWIVFADFEGANLTRIRPEGGNPEVILRATKPEFVALAAVAGADAVLVQTVISSNPDAAVIEMVAIDGSSRQPLIRGGAHPLHAAGYLFFLRSGSLHAQRFNVMRRAVEGTAVPVLDGIRSEIDGIGQVAIARDGSLAYVPGGLSWLGTPAWVGGDGTLAPLGAPKQSYGTFRLSPDGRRIAIVIAGHTDDIWIYEIARGSFVRLTHDGNNSLPVWSPDGQRVAYMKIKDGATSLAWKPVDGSGPEEQIAAKDCAPWSFSRDGGFVAATCDADIHLVPTSGASGSKPFITSKFSEWARAFHRTASGSHSSRTHPAATRSTSGSMPARAASGRYRATAAKSPCGHRTAARSSTATSAS